MLPCYKVTSKNYNRKVKITLKKILTKQIHLIITFIHENSFFEKKYLKVSLVHKNYVE